MRFDLKRAPWAASCPTTKSPETTRANTTSRAATANTLLMKTRTTSNATYMVTSRKKYAIPRQVGLSYTEPGRTSMTGLRVVGEAVYATVPVATEDSSVISILILLHRFT